MSQAGKSKGVQKALPPSSQAGGTNQKDKSSASAFSQKESLKDTPDIKKGKPKKGKGISSLIESFIPGAVYNPDTKKILGILSAEDLLLIALIFIFADSKEEDSSLICLALLYVLISDYIDLSDYF